MLSTHGRYNNIFGIKFTFLLFFRTININARARDSHPWALLLPGSLWPRRQSIGLEYILGTQTTGPAMEVLNTFRVIPIQWKFSFPPFKMHVAGCDPNRRFDEIMQITDLRQRRALGSHIIRVKICDSII